MNGQDLLIDYETSILEYIDEETICKAILQLVNKIELEDIRQTWKRDIMPILCFLYRKIGNFNNTPIDVEIRGIVISIAEQYISGNSIPCNSRVIDKDKLIKIFQYTKEILLHLS